MADEAAPQEITPTGTVDAPAVSTTETETPVTGGDDQVTESPADDIDGKPEDGKPEPKSYDEAYVKKLRDEAAAARVKGKEAAERAAQEAAAAASKELTEKLARTLGLIDDTNPEQLLKAAADREATLAAERDSVASELRALRIEKALNAAADKVDGDTSILAPYLTGTGALNKLDPAADDFASQVEAIVTAAVESNPKLKKTAVQVAAPRSGGDLSGGNAAPNRRGPKTVEEIRREMREKRERDGF